MMTSLLEQLSDRGFRRCLIGTWGAADTWPSPLPTTYFLLPGRPLRGWWRFLSLLRQAQALAVVGADMLDGYYGSQHSLMLLRLADLGARAGLSSTVVGSSLNESVPAEIRRLFKKMSPDVLLCARDPDTKGRLDAICGRDTQLVADIAFFLRPTPPGESPAVQSIQSWIQAQRQQGAPFVIGCNLNPMPVVKAGVPMERLLRSYLDGIRRLRDRHGNIALVLLPHDWRDTCSDAEALAQLNKALPADIARNAYLLDHPVRAGEIKSIASSCDFVLSGRMHLTIASLGCQVPVGCIGYQGKVGGLFSYFGLSQCVLEWQQAIEPVAFCDWVDELAETRVTIAKKIAQELPRVREMAGLNLSRLAEAALLPPKAAA